MVFHYLCPQGHLLEEDESQVGQKRRCPYCGTVLLVPEPLRRPTAEGSAGPVHASPDAGLQAPPDRQPVEGASPGQPSEALPSQFQQAAEKPPPVPPPVGEPPGRPNPPNVPQIQIAAEPATAAGRGDAPGQFRILTAAEQPIVHVICPAGHPLETPREILGQEALCPFCRTQFRLRLEDSLEYREEMGREKGRRKARAARLRLRWIIIAAAALVLGTIALILLSAAR